MFRKKLLHPYILINLIFIILILSIFLYSLLFSAEKSNYPVHSNYTTLTNNTSISTGLSRSFSEIVRLNFAKAKEYNRYGLQIFIFFLSQLILRIVSTGILLFSSRLNKISIITDIILSSALFIVLFRPYIIELAGIFVRSMR